MATLKEIYDLLQDSNNVLEIKAKLGSGKLHMSENEKYIRYSHFGTSAVKNNIDDLSWVLDKIFEIDVNQDIQYQKVGFGWGI